MRASGPLHGRHLRGGTGRAAPVGTGAGAGARARSTSTPLYSQVTPRAWRQQARAGDARGAQPGRGKSRRPGAGLGWIVPTCSADPLWPVLESLEAAMTSSRRLESGGARPGGLRFRLPGHASGTAACPQVTPGSVSGHAVVSGPAAVSDPVTWSGGEAPSWLRPLAPGPGPAAPSQPSCAGGCRNLKGRLS